MGTVSLIMGIFCVIIALIPLFGVIAFMPAIIALVLGIVFVSEQAKKKEPKGKGIAGIVLSSTAILVIITYYVIFGALIATADFSEIGIFKSMSKQTELQVGETAGYKDLEVKYVSLDSYYTSSIEAKKVKPNHKIIKLVIEMKNTGNAAQYIYEGDFKCYADDYVCNNVYYETETGLSGAISKDKKIIGNLFFEVPQDVENITVEYDTYGLLPFANKLVFRVR